MDSGQTTIICGLRHGLDATPQVLHGVAAAVRHMEACHHMPIACDDESLEEAVLRFLQRHPEARECRQCWENGMPWARTPRIRAPRIHSVKGAARREARRASWARH